MTLPPDSIETVTRVAKEIVDAHDARICASIGGTLLLVSIVGTSHGWDDAHLKLNASIDEIRSKLADYFAHGRGTP